MLEKCVAMLQQNDRADLALRILKRYTAKDFQTAAEWDEWLSKNKDKLFFTETGGYRFMINTYS